MTLEELRRALEQAERDLPRAELADAIGACAATQARLHARLTAPPAAPSSSPVGEWVTAAEVARRFSLSVSTINELSRLGRLPHRMFGRYRRFSLAELTAALDSECAEHGIGDRAEKAA
ncbi:helix-turn-helix domain-containing protein [bacterium]|nr:helix-turn-helix domain-containing protein [bacterium]